MRRAPPCGIDSIETSALATAPTHLCFERHEGEWSLTIREGRPELEDWSTTPLLKASRRRRMEAARLLTALVDELVVRVEGEIGQVEKSIGATHGFIERLRHANG